MYGLNRYKGEKDSSSPFFYGKFGNMIKFQFKNF